MGSEMCIRDSLAKPAKGFSNDSITQIVFGPDRIAYLIGLPWSKGGGWDITVSKILVDGRLEWEARVASERVEFVNSIALSSDGNIAICGFRQTEGRIRKKGTFLALFNPDGDLVWEKTYFHHGPSHCDGVTFMANNDIVLVGNQLGNFEYIPFILRISSSGEILWSNFFDKLNEGKFDAVSVFLEDQILIGANEWDIEKDGVMPYLIHLSGSGSVKAHMKLDFINGERITHFAYSESDGVFFGGTPFFDSDSVFGTIKTTGTIEWHGIHPSPDAQIVIDVEILDTGELIALTHDQSNQVFKIIEFGREKKPDREISLPGCEDSAYPEGALSPSGDVFVTCGKNLLRASIVSDDDGVKSD